MVLACRLPLAPLTSEPGFTVIGAQKCGTTALFSLLTQHPSMQSPIVKETRFFDRWPDRNIAWYRANFRPTLPRRLDRSGRGKLLTGEATPEYMVFPHVAPALAARFPDQRIIALTRDPIERAYSQYQMNIARGREWLSFDDALRAEERRLSAGPGQPGSPEAFRWSHFGYVERGRYAHQLEHWLNWYPREQLLVLEAADLANQQDQTLRRVTDFLGLAPMETSPPARENVGTYNPMSDDARAFLSERLCGEASSLYRLLGTKTGWQGTISGPFDPFGSASVDAH